MIVEKIIVDAVGEACPVPVVKANRALKELRDGDILEVHVDNENAVQNLMRLASGKGLRCEIHKVGETCFAVIMTTDEKGTESGNDVVDAAVPVAGAERVSVAEDVKTKRCTVVAIGSDCMGDGDEELGKILMKGFIYALSQREELPRTILFYNSGARIPMKGAVSCEDLHSMEERGTEVLTCGTCLDFYGLTENLGAGSITNMYTIAEKLYEADKVIKP